MPTIPRNALIVIPSGTVLLRAGDPSGTGGTSTEDALAVNLHDEETVPAPGQEFLYLRFGGYARLEQDVTLSGGTRLGRGTTVWLDSETRVLLQSKRPPAAEVHRYDPGLLAASVGLFGGLLLGVVVLFGGQR